MKCLLVLLAFSVAYTAGFKLPDDIVHPVPNLSPMMPPVDGRIVGGTLVPSISNRAFQVALFRNDNKFCSGSIIGAQWILTAAHCVYGASKITVSGGILDLQKYDTAPLYQTITLSDTNSFVHGHYSPNSFLFDIALLKLNTALVFTSTSPVQKINLPSTADANSLFVGVTATASGWGHTSQTSEISQYLRWVGLNVITITECRSYWEIAHLILCTDSPYVRSTCIGDSGGPLTYNNALIGIISFGTGQCDGSVPDGYARINFYLDWIESITNISAPAV